jgi:transcriptional regulator with XRE-family HTH domain
MPLDPTSSEPGLRGHALRNAHLRERSLARSQEAPPLARTIVRIRAVTLGMTRLEFARCSGISRGTMRDLELGIHTPTRRILQKFVCFCQRCGVAPEQLEELRQIYAGPVDTLNQFIARLELRAGSPRELARRVGISAATLWEYRRGNFPLPRDLLRRLCEAVGEDVRSGQELWHATERQRLLARGYPEPLAEFWVLCAREGYTERRLLKLGISTATVRKLRYLELPPWDAVRDSAQRLCRGSGELEALERLWTSAELKQRRQQKDRFGLRLQALRKQQGVSRRELADLFGIGGKKPARIIKYIEEDGFYSAQAFPAGLAAVLTTDEAEQESLCKAWKDRRRQFHRRHRPETRIELRLVRELYGFELRDMEPILGYTNLEYQRIERGVSPLLDTAYERILDAVQQAGRRRVQALLERRAVRDEQRRAWQTPATVRELVTLLARREGGLIPLMRLLRQAGLQGFWTGRLRAIAQGKEVPAWPVLEALGRAGGVHEVADVLEDWRLCFRRRLQAEAMSPLGLELRLLMMEVAPNLRAFSPRLGFNYSVLVRDMQRIDRDDPIKWFHIERIVLATDLPVTEDQWRGLRALWYTAGERKVGQSQPRSRPAPAARLA